MAILKGVALAVRLDECKIENTQSGPKASLRTSYFAEFDKRTNKASYNRVIDALIRLQRRYCRHLPTKADSLRKFLTGRLPSNGRRPK